MKPIKVEQENLQRAVNSGPTCIQVGNKKYMLIEIDEVSKDSGYVVVDSTEEVKLREALNEYNPILSEEEINKILRR